METLREFFGIEPVAALALSMLLVSAAVLVGVLTIFIGKGGVKRLVAVFRNGNGKEHRSEADLVAGLKESMERGFREVNASLRELHKGQTNHSQEIALLFAKDKEVERRVGRLEDARAVEVEQYKALLSEAIAVMRSHAQGGQG